ncbi:glycoside hydrolase 5 family protein [Aspergillus saccharolyticus JOP 1030-1]|uniref:mannan endo-1,4-beta-mannosidase n=1 Tax=Aspergillus saccharolyticus JOP 1030-1 TaxID=1450539 RepID=A0A318ZKD7_9EURO|nr:mannan endo-1,4-beta-mannosidase A [Aspergillus saccharolyticus JOP 1030-1]PYH48051.1 mannan endo-1,4-beta-mannosidase A [Aspergillus saccharolyticus JOP 1030-1]
MKLSRMLLSLASLALATALPRNTNNAATTAFPSTSGLQFKIDGKTGYFAGTNSYWIGFLTNNDDVDLVMSQLKESDLKILRVWGFNDVTTKPTDGTVWFQLHANSTSTINTGADGLQRLDYVVTSAEKYGVKLIINFVNEWDDYGGMDAYVTAYGASTKTDFYTNTAIQAAYKTYIKAVVSRYSSSSAIFAWELANEPRCQGCDTSVLYNWISATSKYIKSLDSKHLVTIGDEGFGLDTDSDGSYPYTYGEGLNFTKNLGISTIDFGTLHLYPDSWGTSYDWGNGWITAHAAACKAVGKPCLLEEYGVTSNHCTVESPWQQTAGNATGISGDLYWQYGTTFSWGQSPNDGNTIYYNTSDFQCLVTDHVAAINAKSK